MRSHLLIPTLCALLAWAPTADATTVTPLSTPELAQRADAVVRGTVTQIWPELAGRGQMVVTRVRIDIVAELKGTIGQDHVVVQIPGGTYGGAITMVDGMPRYGLNEEVVVFLARHDSGHWSTLGAVQGKYTVRFDPRARTEIVQRMAVPTEMVYDHRLAPFPDAESRVLWTAFEDLVLNEVK